MFLLFPLPALHAHQSVSVLFCIEKDIEIEIEKGDCGPPTRKVFFFRFCRTSTKRYLITSHTRVKRVSRIHHLRMVRWCIPLTRLTLVCEVIRYRLVQIRQNLKKSISALNWTADSPHTVLAYWGLISAVQTLQADAYTKLALYHMPGVANTCTSADTSPRQSAQTTCKLVTSFEPRLGNRYSFWNLTPWFDFLVIFEFFAP